MNFNGFFMYFFLSKYIHFFFTFQAEIQKTNDQVYELKKDINECLTGPCQNYLQCIDLDDGFECKCQPGFKGRKCEVNIDDCLSNPCSRNGHCIDKVNGY